MLKSLVSEVVTATLSHQPGSESSARAHGVFHVECRDKNGNLEWMVDVAENTLANDGANKLRDLWFKNAAAIGDSIYMGLATAAPSVTTLLSTVTEATGGGYARKQVTNANWATTTGSANNTAAPASWTASGTQIVAVSHLFITNAASGTVGVFFSFAALTGGPYTVNVGSTLNVTYTWTVS